MTRYQQETQRRLAAMPVPARTSLPPDPGRDRRRDQARAALAAVPGLPDVETGVQLAVDLRADPSFVADVARQVLDEQGAGTTRFWAEVSMAIAFKQRRMLAERVTTDA